MALTFHPALGLAWRSLWLLKKQRQEPYWARLMVGSALALPFAPLLAVLAGFLLRTVLPPEHWPALLAASLLFCLSICHCMLGITSLIERVAARDWLEKAANAQAHPLLAGVVSLAVIGGGFALGIGFGMAVLYWGFDLDLRSLLSALPQVWRNFGLALLILSLAYWIWWRVRVKQQLLQQQAAEAQLRLLQGQIEPHFLFNTLANVQSLMDYDPPRAKQMLEAFTDYLRASLGQLRLADSTLEAELAMAENYLQLLQIRMGERLRFEIEADATARSAVLPPLLLQPLIENAIYHGLEPKVEGGYISIRACVQQEQLQICVDDDGLGQQAARRLRRGKSNGMALSNIRARLQTRYGDEASLAMPEQEMGTRVLLSLPFTAVNKLAITDDYRPDC